MLSQEQSKLIDFSYETTDNMQLNTHNIKLNTFNVSLIDQAIDYGS